MIYSTGDQIRDNLITIIVKNNFAFKPSEIQNILNY